MDDYPTFDYPIFKWTHTTRKNVSAAHVSKLLGQHFKRHGHDCGSRGGFFVEKSRYSSSVSVGWILRHHELSVAADAQDRVIANNNTRIQRLETLEAVLYAAGYEIVRSTSTRFSVQHVAMTEDGQPFTEQQRQAEETLFLADVEVHKANHAVAEATAKAEEARFAYGLALEAHTESINSLVDSHQ